MSEGKSVKQKITKASRVIHRDLGYFFLGLIVAYSISGLALNHVDDWNPDFVIAKKNITVQPQAAGYKADEATLLSYNALVGEEKHKTVDYPTDDQIKLYYDNATLHIYLASGKGEYESLRKRHVFYEANVLHRNSLKGWKWISDIFAVALILIALTGLLIPQGKNGALRGGEWYMAAGLLLPTGAVALFYLLT